MKSVKNTALTPLEIGIDGFDYTFPAGVEVACEDNIADFILASFPLFEVKRISVGKEGDAIPRAEKKASKVYTKRILDKDMYVTKRKIDDTTPPNELPGEGVVDADGIEWTGKGLEVDNINS